MSVRIPPFVIVGVVWIVGALAFGHYELARLLPYWGPPLVPFTIFAVAAFLYAVYGRSREGLLSLGIRGLSLLEGTRLASLYIVWEYLQGRLPANFALPNGIASVLVALVFIGIGLRWRDGNATKGALNGLILLNILGFVQAVAIVGAVGWFILTGQAAPFRRFSALPLNLFPTLVVPLSLFIHLVMIHKIGKMKRALADASLLTQRGVG